MTSLDKPGKLISIKLSKIKRWGTFTVWCWTLEGIYFILVTFGYFLSGDNGYNYVIGTLTYIILEISFSMSILVTTVVTFVLIPAAMKTKEYKKAFKPRVLILHNFNLIFMMIESLLNGIAFNYYHISFCIYYGLIYIIFSWFFTLKYRVFAYFFLDWNKKGVALVYMALFFVFMYYFVVTTAIT